MTSQRAIMRVASATLLAVAMVVYTIGGAGYVLVMAMVGAYATGAPWGVMTMFVLAEAQASLAAERLLRTLSPKERMGKL